MQPRSDHSAQAAAARDAARSAADGHALALRVAELEGTLTKERARNAACVRDVDAVMRTLRQSLQTLQDDARRMSDERDRLREQLRASRENLAALVGEPSNASALAEMRADLDAARVVIEAVTLERDELQVRLAELVAEPSRRTSRDQPPAALPAAPSASAQVERPSARAAVETHPSHASNRANATDPDTGTLFCVDSTGAEAPDAKCEDLSADEMFLTSDPAAAELRSRSASSDISSSDGSSIDSGKHLSVLPAAQSDDSASVPYADQPLSGVPARQDAAAPFADVPTYRIEGLVEESSAGAVYEVREVATRRPLLLHLLPVALKQLDGRKLDAMLVARHANLVGVDSFAVCQAGPYLVIDRPTGESAERWVQRVGPLPERIAIAVGLECARGLREAARHDALHLDLTPERVLIDAMGRVQVRGVGLAGLLALPRRGSAAFAAPERLRDGPPADARADIYSLGAVLYFLFTGRAPYEGSPEQIARLQAVAAPDVRELRPEVSADAARLVRHMLTFDPNLRPAAWDDVLVALEGRVPGQSTPALQGNLGARLRRFAIVNPWILPLAVAGLLAAAVCARVIATSDDSAAARFRVSKARAAALQSSGDIDGAREELRPFLRSVGDPAVEREAARLYDDLPPR